MMLDRIQTDFDRYQEWMNNKEFANVCVCVCVCIYVETKKIRFYFSTLNSLHFPVLGHYIFNLTRVSKRHSIISENATF